jgi:hypothetical protein
MDLERSRGTTVLIVEADPQERDRLGSALERSGFDVLGCTGPTGPEYVCVGGRAGRCALIDGADVVVLDLWLRSDGAMVGTPSSELLRVYLAAGRPVVTLGTPDDHGFAEEPVIHLERTPEPEDLVRAVRTLTRHPRSHTSD